MKSAKSPKRTMNDIKLYIGLDVHKDSVHCGIAHAGRDKPEVYGKWAGSNLEVERGLCKLLKKFKLKKNEVAICCEAGPTGFVLVRRLIQLGYDAIVIAPSKIPKQPGGLPIVKVNSAVGEIITVGVSVCGWPVVV